MGILDSLFGSKTKTTKNPFETNPWADQQPYLNKGFQQASQALSGALNSTKGLDLAADMNDTQKRSLQRLSGVGINASEVGGGALNSATSGFDSMGAYQTNANGLAGGTNMSAEGLTQDAATYASNPYLDAQIDSAIGDVARGFGETQSEINGAAVGTGNINSTRAGVLESRALDDAMDRAGDISSSMRSASYENGLERAMQTATTNHNSALAGNEALGGSVDRSMDLATSGFNLAGAGADTSLSAGDRWQVQNQAEIDARLQSRTLPLDLVSQYMATVGGNYGNSGYTSNISKSPSIFQQVGGAAASLFGAGAFG